MFYSSAPRGYTKKKMTVLLRPQVFFMYQPEHCWLEAFVIIRRELAANLGCALLGVLLISSLLLAHPIAVALMVASVVVVDLLLLGEMWLAHIPLSTISVVNLVVAVGLALGYSMHVMHAFLSTAGPSRMARVRGTMLRAGAAVLLAMVSTLCGVIVLSGAASAIMRIFFQMLLGTVLIGGCVGILVLPAVLSFIGPKPCFLEHAGVLPEELSRTMRVDETGRRLLPATSRGDAAGNSGDVAEGADDDANVDSGEVRAHSAALKPVLIVQ